MKFSVITVTYNAQQCVERAIRSVVSQDYEDFEYLVIDGLSTDDTMSIVRRFEREISLIVSESDNGIYDAMNKAADLASGDYLIYLNADDNFISETALSCLARGIRQSPHADIYHGAVVLYHHGTGFAEIKKHRDYDAKTMYRTTLPHQATVYRRDFFQQLGKFDTNYPIAADFDLLVRAYKSGKRFYFLNVLVTVFSMGGTSTSAVNKTALVKERRAILEANFTLLQLLYLRFRVRFKKIFGF